MHSTIALGILSPKDTLVGAKDSLRSFDSDEDPAAFGLGPQFGHSTSVIVTGASRTDAGVHATRQVFHVDIPRLPVGLVGSLIELVASTNKHIADGITLHSLTRCISTQFDASRASIGKRYTYFLYDGREPLSTLNLDATKLARVFDLYNDSMRAHTPEKLRVLDVEKMNRASKAFIGTHDFRLFTRSAKRCAKAKDSKERTIRTIFKARLQRDKAGIIQFEVEGNGFLYLMVRCMMSALIDVGRGSLTIEELELAVLAPSIPAGRPPDVFSPVQPSGLTLDEVYYKEGSFPGAVAPSWAFKLDSPSSSQGGLIPAPQESCKEAEALR